MSILPVDLHFKARIIQEKLSVISGIIGCMNTPILRLNLFLKLEPSKSYLIPKTSQTGDDP